MIRQLTIKNYKSILAHTIELGRINVFIGENGCGKTNILEAVAMAAAALTNKLSVEELFNRGMRVPKPSIMRSSFPGTKAKEIILQLGVESLEHPPSGVELHISSAEDSVADVKWFNSDLLGATELREVLFDNSPGVHALRDPDLEKWAKIVAEDRRREQPRQTVGDFAIYNLNILALRGLHVVSRRAPLGIYGETLDFAISTLKPELWADVLERAKCISWLENIVVDPTDQLKYQGHKLGGSQSALYFFDKHMRRKNNVFSAENVNEGILHVLFHLTLFASESTPKVLGIDNIEAALNPQLCRDLMKQLAELAAKHGKQALITTHNPAILDGLNLHDDEQRLFVVYRTDDGHTVTKRIKTKPQPDGAKLKLSELWMRGHLGGIPRNF
jgi:energy-coupling factor transporter ATP-binding protein EcfA2